MTTKYVPIFEKDDNLFFIPHQDWVADDDNAAHEIGWGASFVEGIIFGFKFKEVRVIDSENIPHVKTKINHSKGSFDVCVVAGPIFDKVNNEQNNTSV